MELSDDLIFEDLLPSLSCEEGWTQMEPPTSDGKRIAFRKVKKKCFFVRMQVPCELDASSSRKMEHLFHDALNATGMEFCDGTSVKLLQTLGPGDIRVSMKPSGKWRKLMLRSFVLLGGKDGGCPADTTCQEEALEYRMVHRPVPGGVAAVYLAEDQESGTYMSGAGYMTSLWSTYTKDLSGNCMATYGMLHHGHTVPSCHAHHIASLAEAFLEDDERLFKECSDMGLYQEDQDRPRPYIVLSLKACSRGFPMLPAGPLVEQLGVVGSVLLPDGQAWVQPSACEKGFPKFLQLFLDAIGCGHVQVFGYLDGQPLMCWQAVVLRTDWELASPIFEEYWKCGKAAYRKLYKTKSAPCVSVVAEPRFATRSEYSATVNDKLYNVTVPTELKFVAKKTFIELVEDCVSDAESVASA